MPAFFVILNAYFKISIMNTVFYFQAEDINAIIRTVSAITAFGLCVLSERHKRHNVIYAYLQMFILCMGLWDAFLVGYLIVYDPNIAAFFNSMLYVFSSFACVFFFLFCIKYAYPEKTYPSFFVSIFAVPCITTLLALTYPFQGLLFSYAYVFVYNPTRILQMYPGVWYYIHLIYSYGICIIGMVFLIRKVNRKNTSDKKTFLPLLILCLCIVAVNILFTLTQNNNFYAVALSGAGHLICILALYLSVRFDKTELMISMCSSYMEKMFPVPLFIIDCSDIVVFRSVGGSQILRAHGIAEYTMLNVNTLFSFFTKTELPMHIMEQKNDDSSDIFLLQDNLNSVIYYAETKPLISKRNERLGKMLLFTNITKINKLLVSLESFAFSDVLTGAYNRHYYEIKRALFSESPVFPMSIMMCDIDNLKKVNDNYGHKVGDEYIVACCSSLFHNLRKSDLIFRLGGDEFLVLLPRTTAEQTKMLLEKIENNLFLPEGNFPFLRGLSIGCATMNESDEFSFEKLQHMADVEMYKTKAQRKAGRL